MRITNEADYALRISYYLGVVGKKANAKDIADKTGVTLRFALKILRKLSLAEIVGSQQGANGGYFLSKSPDDISVGEILEIIDGPFRINNCISHDYVCTRVGDDMASCPFHQYFCRMNDNIHSSLYAAKLSEFVNFTNPDIKENDSN